MLQILAYTIPSLVVVACVWIVMHKMFKNEADKRLWELKLQSQKEITPTRLRAYERLTLLLERTTPEHMLVEMNLTEMTTIQLQQRLLLTIRTEFDHNLSQQIYVSNDVWQKIITARDEMATFINSVAAQSPKDCTALEYATALITAYENNGTTTHTIALAALKQEASQMLC
ncbi:MAG: hypothetical protein MJZ92_06075 [Paludibacteraceae bacterium]|nr:hypothetical protein [Paludibacteraceae bacterium]